MEKIYVVPEDLASKFGSKITCTRCWVSTVSSFTLDLDSRILSSSVLQVFHWVSEGYTKQNEKSKQASNCVIDSFLTGSAEQRCEDPIGSSLQRVFNEGHLGPSTRESRPPGVLPRNQGGRATR